MAASGDALSTVDAAAAVRPHTAEVGVRHTHAGLAQEDAHGRRVIGVADPHPVRDRPHGPEWETFHVPVVPGLLRRGANLVSVQVQTAQASSAPVL